MLKVLSDIYYGRYRRRNYLANFGDDSLRGLAVTLHDIRACDMCGVRNVHWSESVQL